MPEPVTQVPAEPTPASVAAPAATPAPGTVATPVATPSQPAVDAEALRRQNEELAAKVSKYEQDVNKLKSVYQRRESEINRTHEERERQFQDELRRVQMSSMDEEEKKEFERQLDQQRLSELQDTVSQLQREKQELDARYNAETFFTENNVPITALNRAGSLDELVQSGYAWMSNRIKELETRAPSTPNQPPATPPPAAPPVDTSNGAPSTIRPTWPDIEKELRPLYGNQWQEEFYKGLIAGRIPQDRLPLKEQK
jgi:murein L,D-transpeptidase YcbB/YkuD